MLNIDDQFDYKVERDVDMAAKETYSWWGRYYIIMKKTRVKTWKAFFIISFLSGALVAGSLFTIFYIKF